jgi:alcohol dehydrogenase
VFPGDFALSCAPLLRNSGSGTSREIEETLHFAALTGIRPLIEEVPLIEAQSALERMSSGQARVRMVLATGR